MKNRNFLSEIFVYIRDVIDSANLPLVVLILVVLPLIVPIVPASVTGMNLFYVMQFPLWMSVISGITIELLGFSSAILALRSITELVNGKNSLKGLWVQMFVDVGAWLFYLIAVVMINVVMDNQIGKPNWYVIVIGFLCLLSVPSSMLAATRINTRETNEQNERLRQEQREDKMERYKLRVQSKEQRTNVRRTNERAERTPIERSENGSFDVRKKIAEYVLSIQQNEQRTPGPSEISRSVGVSKSYASDTLRIILETQAQQSKGDIVQ